jgi:hypothetical protein
MSVYVCGVLASWFMFCLPVKLAVVDLDIVKRTGRHIYEFLDSFSLHYLNNKINTGNDYFALFFKQFWFNVKLTRYQFWCNRCAFRLFKSLQWYLGQKKDGNPKEKKNCENCTRAEKNQILCHEVEPNPLKDRAMHERVNPPFWDEFTNLLLSW